MNWYQVTTAARERLSRRCHDIFSEMYRDWHNWASAERRARFKERYERARADYRQTILRAYDVHRPDGPLAGEQVPNEVARLREET